MDHNGFVARFRRVGEVMSSFAVTVKQMWPNPSLRQVLVWASSETNFHRHLRDSDYDEEWRKPGEYMFLMTMNETGEEIVDVLEFVDSKATEDIVGLVARALKTSSAESWRRQCAMTLWTANSYINTGYIYSASNAM
jgi:hypothetical protein